MSGSLVAHSVGVILLGVHDLGMLYTCTSAEILHVLNDLPTANLVIGQGVPLSDSEETAQFTNGQLQTLLEAGVELRKIKETGDTTASSKLLRCSIYEADSKGTDFKAIFRGYIVSVLEISRAGNLTVKALRVQCMGIAAVLHVTPLAGYRRTTGASLINAAAGLGELPTARATLDPGVIDQSAALSNTTDAAIVEKFADQLISTDILTRLAYMANTLVYMSEAKASNQAYQKLEKADDNLLRIKDCIFCNYVVSPKLQEYAANANKSFNKFLCGQLLQTMQSASILMTIGSVCTGTDVMMNLVPHFKYGGGPSDFRMELKPIEAWNATNAISIPIGYVTACNSTLNHLEHLEDPQVLIVNYSSGVGEADPSGQEGIPSKGCFGVYSPLAKVVEWAKVRYRIQDKPQTNTDMGDGVYRTRFYPAPRWLDWSYLSNKHTDAKDLQQPLEVPDNDVDAKSGWTTEQLNNLTAAAEQADEIAQALYAHLHGSSDVASFDLTPDLRFGLNGDIGCLENHIGSVVDVNGYRGMLQAVRYTYTSGKTTTSSFSITLSRVRPVDKDEKPIKCPLYASLGETELQNEKIMSSSYATDYLWRDDWKTQQRQ